MSTRFPSTVIAIEETKAGSLPFEIIRRHPEVSASTITIIRRQLGLPLLIRGRKRDFRRPAEYKAATNGKTQAQFASSLGVSRQCVNQIIHQERHLARAAVIRAIKRGSLVRPKRCSSCRQTGRIEAHHDDYSRPLDIKWLCPVCHAQHDRICRNRNNQGRTTA